MTGRFCLVLLIICAFLVERVVVTPSMVWVLPHPVWPYAKIVPLYPLRTFSTRENEDCS